MEDVFHLAERFSGRATLRTRANRWPRLLVGCEAGNILKVSHFGRSGSVLAEMKVRDAGIAWARRFLFYWATRKHKGWADTAPNVFYGRF